MAAFIAAQRAEHGVPHAVCCRALGVSQAWFYKWRGGDSSLRRKRRAALTAVIAYLFGKHRGAYGSPRITADLRDLGWKVSENTVAELMREQGLVARRRYRRRGTTRPGRGRWRAPDLIGRDFHAERINRKWFGDGTEIPTCSRRTTGNTTLLPDGRWSSHGVADYLAARRLDQQALGNEQI